MSNFESHTRRVIVVQWKNRPENPFDIFSSLKNLCLSYPQFNYNTISNYLSKAKLAYENPDVRIERRPLWSAPIIVPEVKTRKIVPILHKTTLKNSNDEIRDLDYWLSRPVQERAAAVTFIIGQTLKKGQRMDKSHVIKTSRIK